jgi:two-component system phosphate regulon response regulator PhoB
VTDRNGPLVLVADDEADIVTLVAIVLERAGFRVITAGDGAAALDLAREHVPSACVLDGTMPGLAGFEVIEALREQGHTAGIRVLILTATVDEEREIRRHGVEPDSFMKKPFDSDELIAEVFRLVR